MMLFLVQHGDAKLETEDPSDPWGEWQTGLLESETESPVTTMKDSAPTHVQPDRMSTDEHNRNEHL